MSYFPNVKFRSRKRGRPKKEDAGMVTIKVRLFKQDLEYLRKELANADERIHAVNEASKPATLSAYLRQAVNKQAQLIGYISKGERAILDAYGDAKTTAYFEEQSKKPAFVDEPDGEYKKNMTLYEFTVFKEDIKHIKAHLYGYTFSEYIRMTVHTQTMLMYADSRGNERMYRKNFTKREDVHNEG